MFARITLALPLGAAATGALLFLMHHLIETGEVRLEPVTARITDFTRIERNETVQLEQKRPDPPATPAEMPDLALLDTGADAAPSIEFGLAEPEVSFSAKIEGMNFDASDGEYLPLYKAPPQYPIRALQRRLEGYVIVEYIVTTSGAVRDVFVVESSSALFEQAAVEAAQKFKYQPRVVDGQPIEVSGVQNRFTFRPDA